MNVRHLRHVETCATGARAEKRGPCDCGAPEHFPAWTIRVLEEREPSGAPFVEVKTTEKLTSTEAAMFALALLDCTRECGARFARYDSKRDPRAKG